jgi:membrane-associated phospholipid phosphatase
MPEGRAQVTGPEEAPAPTPFFEAAVIASLEGDTRGFDNAVRSWVHRFASEGMTRAMTAISLMGYDILVVEMVIAFVVFARQRWRRAAVWLAVAMTGSLLLDLSLKYAYHRPRPTAFFGVAPQSYSFPSGHALCSLCFYGVMAGLLSARIKSRAWRILVWVAAAALVFAIGISRIYLGVHYPSDVLAGYLAATVWVGTVIVLDHARKVRRKPR